MKPIILSLSLVFVYGISLAQDLSQKENFLKARQTFYKAFEAERAQQYKGLTSGFFSLEGYDTNPRQDYHLNSPFDPNEQYETFIGHWFYDFDQKLFRNYVRLLYHGGHDLRFEELNRRDTSYYITTEMRKYTVSPTEFNSIRNHLLKVPGWFLAQSEADIASLTWVGEMDLEGKKHNVITINWLDVTRWIYVNQESGLVKQISRLSPDLIKGSRQTSLLFSGRKELNGYQVPESIENYVDDQRTETRTIINFSDSCPQDAGIFDLDPDLKTFEEVPWSVAKVSDHVYEIQGLAAGLYTIPLVVFSDHIVMFDAIISPGLLGRALQIIKQEFDKPVRYVVLSHNHTDHIRGLKALRDVGVMVIVGSETEPRVRQLMEAPNPSTRPGNSSMNAGNYKTRLVDPGKPMELSEGELMVKVYNMGATPHVNDLLYLEIQPDNVIIQADSYFEFSKWGEIFDFFVDWVDDSGFDNPIITGTHQTPLRFEELRKRKPGQLKGFVPGYLSKVGLKAE